MSNAQFIYIYISSQEYTVKEESFHLNYSFTHKLFYGLFFRLNSPQLFLGKSWSVPAGSNSQSRSSLNISLVTKSSLWRKGRFSRCPRVPVGLFRWRRLLLELVSVGWCWLTTRRADRALDSPGATGESWVLGVVAKELFGSVLDWWGCAGDSFPL